MSAAIFWKKRIRLIVTGVLSTFVVIAALVYAYALTGVQKIAIGKTFYFVLSDSEHVEAGAHFVSQNGGAGYVLERSASKYVVYAVYLEKADAESVQAALQTYGDEARIVGERVDALYVKGNRSKAEEVCGTFSSFYGCIEVLNGEISRLSAGATQQSSKRILATLRRQFAYLRARYEDREEYAAFSDLCASAEAALRESIEGTVLLKELRYLQCAWCDAYIRLAKTYTL